METSSVRSPWRQHPSVRQSACVQISATERSVDCYKNRYSIPLGKSHGTGVKLVSVDAVTLMLKNINL